MSGRAAYAAGCAEGGSTITVANGAEVDDQGAATPSRAGKGDVGAQEPGG